MKVALQSDKYIQVFVNHKDVVSYLKYTVPSKHRMYDASAKCWVVHVKHLLPIVQLGYAKIGHVDYSALPAQHQMLIASNKKDWTKASSTSRVFTSRGNDQVTAYATLHLQPDAPQCVIKAAYRALSKEHHPDRGGDSDKFKEITQAYEELSK